MAVKIKRVVGANKRPVSAFVRNEWRRFHAERGYDWRVRKHSFSATEKGRILGYVSMETHGGVAYLLKLIVSKRTRGRGIGSRLLRMFEAEAKREKCHTMILRTSDRHTEAMRFYRDRGYRVIATLKDHMFHFTWYYLEKKLKRKPASRSGG
jgi:ribosomal protein S18 acetylase RimI-like enzyme